MMRILSKDKIITRKNYSTNRVEMVLYPINRPPTHFGKLLRQEKIKTTPSEVPKWVRPDGMGGFRGFPV